MTTTPSSTPPDSAAPAGPPGDRGRSLSSALVRYRVMAWVTGVLLVLLTLHVVLQIVQHGGLSGGWGEVFAEKGIDVVVPGLGHGVPIAHGWMYLIYVVVTVDLWMRTRLPAFKTALVVLAGTIPFMSFVAERWVTHRVQPMIDAAGAGSQVARS